MQSTLSTIMWQLISHGVSSIFDFFQSLHLHQRQNSCKSWLVFTRSIGVLKDTVLLLAGWSSSVMKKI